MKTFAEVKEYHTEIVSQIERCTPDFIAGKNPSEVMESLELKLPKYAENYLVFRPEQREKLEAAYVTWMTKTNRWISDDRNPAASYHFLDGHPIFWAFMPNPKTSEDEALTMKKEAMEKEAFNRNEDFSAEIHALNNVFQTTGFAENFWKALGGKKNEPTYMMECGSAVEPARYSHYHDVYLDTYASSFDECYVKTALYVFALHGITEDKEMDTKYHKFFHGKSPYWERTDEENSD